MQGAGVQHKRNGHRINTDADCNRLPVDDLEPEIEHHDAYREASRKMMRVMNAGLAHIEAAFLRREAKLNDVAIAFYQFAFAIGSNICEDKTMTELGIVWGSGDESRAAVSKGATTFCRGLKIRPSFYMKQEAAAPSYQQARIKSIQRCNSNSKAA